MRSAAAHALALALATLLAVPAGPALAASQAPLAPIHRATAPGLDGAPTAGGLDVADRWIVLLKPRERSDQAATRVRALGAKPDRMFDRAVRGYSAKLDAGQLDAVRRDPAVEMVVADEVVSLQAQTVPTGVRRVNGASAPVARIDGNDDRVDADVAIVDTGIDPGQPDLNVAGGVNCSTADRNAWWDDNGHGTHVAGTVGALDNGFGVVGVAPGVRLWSVRILNSAGNGLLSWYVCGLDWITAMRDPADPSRPFFEAVNMSVAKPGTDDHACGVLNSDILHAAICRLVDSGVTVVAAAGNNSFNAARMVPAAYDEVITVSALADTDGLAGGIGGNACSSWGGYDRDDTFADFSNYGADVDLIAPGKCILSTLPHNQYGYLSGTSMATPLVTGAVALYKASRPLAPPSQVKAALQAMGNLGWNTATDPDGYHERLLDVSRIVPLGEFSVQAASPVATVRAGGGTLTVPITINRAEDFPDDVTLDLDPASDLAGSVDPSGLSGLDATASSLRITVPEGTSSGTYRVTIRAAGRGQVHSATVGVVVDGDAPTMPTPRLGAIPGSTFGSRSFSVSGGWSRATDATSSIARYQAQWRVDGAAWGSTITLGSATTQTTRRFALGHRYQLRVRAADAAGNWSPWSSGNAFTAGVVQDSSRSLSTSGRWMRYATSVMSGGSSRYAKAPGASIALRFTGRSVSIVAPMSRARGKANVWIDGALVRTISLYRSTTAYRRVVFTQTWTESATHVIKIVVLGTVHRPRVDIDAFVVLR